MFRKYRKNELKLLYDRDQENDIITPKRQRKSIGTITDYRENKRIKFKDEKIKNNYEKVITTINEIKQNNKKNVNNTVRRKSVDYNTEFIKNQRKQLFFNNNKIIIIIFFWIWK